MQATTEPNSSRFRSDFHNRVLRTLTGLHLKSHSLIQTRNHKKRQVDLPQQLSRDAEPLRIELISANGLSRTTVPVRCVTLIAFLAMQVCVSQQMEQEIESSAGTGSMKRGGLKVYIFRLGRWDPSLTGHPPSDKLKPRPRKKTSELRQAQNQLGLSEL